MAHNGFMHPHRSKKQVQVEQAKLIGRTGGLITQISRLAEWVGGLAGRTGWTVNTLR
ncbi:MAG: hypothetical protein KAT00_10225 [Planctomycetes bacterium]|nr:hypothetical protein [Planctomycetota bacterium]